MEYILVTLVRLFVPLSILRWPLLGTIIAAYIDYRDWDFLGINTQAEMSFYQTWDKLLDTYYLALAWYTSFAWKDRIARTTAFFLFFYRVLGVFIGLISDRSLLLFFPNSFEWFFWFYLLFIRISKKAILFSSGKILFLVLLVVTIPKIVQEYFMHVLRKPPWEVFPITQNANWSFWLWILIFLVPQLVVLFTIIKFVSKSSQKAS